MRQLIFTPNSYLSPNTTYTLKVNNLANVLGGQSTDFVETFTTPSLPDVDSASITDGQTNVPACNNITVHLNQNPSHSAEFSFSLSPDASIVPTLSSDGQTYTLTPNDCLVQNTKYSLNIQRLLTVRDSNGLIANPDETPITIKTISFATKGAPEISAMSPQGGNIPIITKEIKVSFSQPMATDNSSQYLSLQPAITGTWAWTDSQTLIFSITGNLLYNTKYGVIIGKGLKDTKGGFIAQDISYSFTTIGPVKVLNISPRNGSGNVKVGSPIDVSFDQAVDHNSAQQNFSITPNVTGQFSWQGQTMIYSTSNLSKDASYKIFIASGIVSLAGQPSTTSVSSTFQTEQSVLVLNIPVYYQQSALSCEVASLKMALGYKGINVSESTLLANIGVDATPRQGDIWGDPNQAFVGDVNGHQDTTGYGVYATPIARTANSYTQSSAVNGLTTSQIAGYLAKNQPVILWGTAGNAKSDSWTTPAGKQINGWFGEHARLIIGFTGLASNPTGFIINDPIFGRLTWSPSQLSSNMAAFGGMGVVIL